MGFLKSTLLLTLVSTLSLTLGCATPHKKTEKPLSDKDRVPLLLDVAAANLTEGDPTGALQNLDQAREINDSVPEEQYLYALAYYQKHEIKLATEAAKKAIRLRPNYSQAKNTLGRLLIDAGKLDEAEAPLLSAAKDLTFRESYIAKTNLGIIYYKKMKFDQADQWLSDAIRDGGESACMASYYRGQIDLEKNELTAAQKDFHDASRGGCSQFSDAHLAMGKTLMRMKKYDQARAKFLEVKEIFPASDASSSANQFLKEIP